MSTAADLDQTWALLTQLQQLIAQQYSAEISTAIEASGLSGRPLGMLIHAGDFDPQPLTAAGLQRCVPYYAAAAFMPRMADLAAHGLLAPVAGGAYRLTIAGRRALDTLERTVQTKLAAVQAQLGNQPDRLDNLLQRLVAACLASPAVPDQACVAGTGNHRPNHEPSALGRIARSAYTLLTYRCDAHRAAWQAHDISGPAWETFAQIADGQAESASTMLAWSERQPVPRGYSAGDYATFLHDLAERGWIAEKSGAYRATRRGWRLRQAVEELTDQYFYSPWSALGEASLAELHILIEQLLGQLSSSPKGNQKQQA